ncbi:MAG: DsbA family protein [Pseudomonadota bacterium]
MATLEIYWSFRSPYSYLAVDRLIAIRRDFEIEIDFRPVRPLALREPDYFEKARPQFLTYLISDVRREAERLRIPVSPPDPDPVRMDMATGVVDAEQPNMHRLMALGLAACSMDKGLDFAAAVAKRIWTGVAGWYGDEHLAAAATDASVSFDALQAWADGNEDAIAKTIARNEAAQLVHHWGVPLMVLDGEPFFGQDRINALIWRLDGLGLRRD